MPDDSIDTPPPPRGHYFQHGDHVRVRETPKVRGTFREYILDPQIGLPREVIIELAPESIPLVRLTAPPNILHTACDRVERDLPKFESDVLVTVADQPGHVIAHEGGEVWVAIKVHPRLVREVKK